MVQSDYLVQLPLLHQRLGEDHLVVLKLEQARLNLEPPIHSENRSSKREDSAL